MNNDDRLRTALETLAKAARVAGEAIAKSLSAVQTDFELSGPPDMLTYTDHHGDGVVVDAPSDGWSVLRIRTTEDPVVLLDQDAVNRLAQYLDQHRTDELVMTDSTGVVVMDETLGSVMPGTPVPRMSKCGVCGHGAHGTERCTATVQAFDADAGTCVCLGRAEDHRAYPSAHVDFTSFYCAGWRTQGGDESAGCGHPRDQHDASGCNGALGSRKCPCERRNGA